MLAVENLHWSDPTSEEWLASLVEQLGDMPVLVLTTYRPGYQPPWLRHSAATQIALPRLSPRDSLVVLQSVPQAAQLPASLQQTIVAKAAGNPFFVEELTWTAVGHGDRALTLPLPDTIEAVLAARLDRLPPEAKRLVQMAAVIGPEVPVPLLQAIAALPEATLHRSLAHHALRGEVWDKALRYCRQAGEKAMAHSAYREAMGHFEQGLSALPHLPETRDSREQAIDLRLALRSALLPSGDSERILAYLREAESLAVALDDAHRLGQVSRFLTAHFRHMGAYDQAIAAAQHALALATASGEVVLHALTNYHLGMAYESQGDYRRAIDCFEQTMAFFDGARRRERFGQVFLSAVTSRAWLASCHAELGMFAEGRALGEEGLRIAEAVSHPPSLMWALWGIGLLSLRQGNPRRALPQLERAVDIGQEADLPAHFPWNAVALSVAYTLAGRITDAVSLLTQALEQYIMLVEAGEEFLRQMHPAYGLIDWLQ